jgi:hypothetical protein
MRRRTELMFQVVRENRMGNRQDEKRAADDARPGPAIKDNFSPAAAASSW